MVSRPLAGLYLVTDGRLGAGLEAGVAAALAGGARIVQYRDKSGDGPRRRREAGRLRGLTREHGALLIVNDDPALAAAVAADGVHVGRGDPPVTEVRRVLGPTALVGVSCYGSLERARAAVAAGADYVAFGSLYPSPTKPQAERASLELIGAAGRELGVPVCAIGGIDLNHLGEVVAAGADLVAVVSAILFADDIERAARRFAETIERARLLKLDAG